MNTDELLLVKNERKVQSRSSGIGFFSIVYGIVGLEFFKTIYSIRVTSETLEIVKSYRSDIIIDLSKVDYIMLRNNELQVYYSDFVKTYN